MDYQIKIVQTREIGMNSGFNMSMNREMDRSNLIIKIRKQAIFSRKRFSSNKKANKAKRRLIVAGKRKVRPFKNSKKNLNFH